MNSAAEPKVNTDPSPQPSPLRKGRGGIVGRALANRGCGAGSPPSRPLPLESGEFMHSRKFLRRYERLPQVKKAELIEGVLTIDITATPPEDVDARSRSP